MRSALLRRLAEFERIQEVCSCSWRQCKATFPLVKHPFHLIFAFSTNPKAPNHSAAGKAGIASWLAIEPHCPGLLEPGRSPHQRCALPLKRVSIADDDN
jgi:hypothetical protein